MAVVARLEGKREEVGVMIAANLKRWQLSRKEKATVVEEYIKLYPDRSNNWIAEDLGVSENTVRDRRQDMESTSQLEKLDTLKGKDGKERPRKQAKPKPPEPEPVQVAITHIIGWHE